MVRQLDAYSFNFFYYVSKKVYYAIDIDDNVRVERRVASAQTKHAVDEIRVRCLWTRLTRVQEVLNGRLESSGRV